MSDDLDDDGMFEINSAQPVEPDSGVSKPSADKTFRAFDPDQS